MKLDPAAVVSVESVSRLSTAQATQIRDRFDRLGFVVLRVPPSPQPRTEFLALSRYFGSIIHHEHSEADGIVPVAPLNHHPEYVNTTNKELLPHTDGSFALQPPKVVAMQCEVAAASGGLTTFVEAQWIYETLKQRDPEGLETLFRPDALTVKRSNRVATKPIFQRCSDRVEMVFRADSAARVTIAPPCVTAFETIKTLAQDPANQLCFQMQPGDIFVFDNTRILHGRTAFAEGDDRRLNRLWFDGKPEGEPLEFGFRDSFDRGFVVSGF